MDKTNHFAQNSGPGHEKSDASIRPIAILGVGLFLLTCAVLLLMAWMFDSLSARQAQSDTTPSPLATTPHLPPEPRLQVTPAEDLKKMRAAEETALQSYEWIDRNAGIVRIPIDRAIELLAERGLPVRTEDRGSRIEDRR